MKQRARNRKPDSHKSAEARAAQPGPQLPTPGEIQRRAYEIFEARGGAPSHEWDDWLLAETELKAETERQRKGPAGARPGSAAAT